MILHCNFHRNGKLVDINRNKMKKPQGGSQVHDLIEITIKRIEKKNNPVINSSFSSVQFNSNQNRETSTTNRSNVVLNQCIKTFKLK